MECRRAMQIFLKALIFLLLCGHSFAVTMDNLYTVVIQVKDNTAETRNKQLPAAFEQVIKRVASSHNVLNHPEYAEARQHLDRFISNYFYIDNGNTFTLTMRFNEQTINNFLKKIGRMTLGKNRPQVLLWLVIDQDNIANFVTHGPQGDLANKLDELASNYGMPIILPLLDLTERLFISENDVLNFNLQPLQQAAERYNTNTLLLGKIKYLSDGWHCDWRLVEGDYNLVWHSNGNNLDEELELMVNHLADQLIAKNTQWNMPNFAKQGITVHVKGVNSVAVYAKVVEHLKMLPIVQKVDVGSVDGTRATFVVTAEGGKDGIIKALQLSNLLTTDSESIVGNADKNNILDLIYKASL